MKYCIIIGPSYAAHYHIVYPLLKARVLNYGVYTAGWEFENNRCWCDWYTTFTPNIPEKKKLILKKTYNEKDYPVYDNYDAIECKSKDIPYDYAGKIGVPTTFFKYYGYLPYDVLEHRGDLKLNGKTVYERLIIRRKQL